MKKAAQFEITSVINNEDSPVRNDIGDEKGSPTRNESSRAATPVRNTAENDTDIKGQ